MSHINSSFSDDGNSYINSYEIGRKSEDLKVLSVQVEYSDRGKPNYFYE
jgi:hypothetical protein